jgi:DNA-binding PadR family transcriptional regulator
MMSATHSAPWDCARGLPSLASLARLAALAAAARGGGRHGHRGGGGRGAPGGRWGPGGRGGAPWGWPGQAGFPPGFGGFGGFGGHFGGRGPKAKRGNVRAAILALLAEEPHNGYQIIQAINERSGGAWKPSPGAVYPALSQLADEGLIRAEERDGRKTFELTDAGRAYMADHPDEVAAPWEEVTADLHDDVHGLFRLAGQTGMAIVQVAQAGSPAQIAKAAEVLAETRRTLYRLLAEGDNTDEQHGEE